MRADISFFAWNMRTVFVFEKSIFVLRSFWIIAEPIRAEGSPFSRMGGKNSFLLRHNPNQPYNS